VGRADSAQVLDPQGPGGAFQLLRARRGRGRRGLRGVTFPKFHVCRVGSAGGGGKLLCARRGRGREGAQGLDVFQNFREEESCCAPAGVEVGLQGLDVFQNFTCVEPAREAGGSEKASCCEPAGVEVGRGFKGLTFFKISCGSSRLGRPEVLRRRAAVSPQG